jgi:hypothetical protein
MGVDELDSTHRKLEQESMKLFQKDAMGDGQVCTFIQLCVYMTCVCVCTHTHTHVHLYVMRICEWGKLFEKDAMGDG